VLLTEGKARRVALTLPAAPALSFPVLPATGGASPAFTLQQLFWRFC